MKIVIRDPALPKGRCGASVSHETVRPDFFALDNKTSRRERKAAIMK